MKRMSEELSVTTLRCAVCHDQCVSACPALESSRQLAAYPSRKAMISRDVDQQLLQLNKDVASVMQYCIGCNACLETCLYRSHPNDITPVIRHTRRELFEHGDYSDELKLILANVEKWGNPYGDLTTTRKRLLNEIQGEKEKKGTILVIGDSSILYFSEQMAVNSLKLIKEVTDSNIGLAESTYCGWELWHYGAVNWFENNAKAICKEIEVFNPLCVVTLSPQSAVLLRETFHHELGLSISVPVFSMAEFILEKVENLKGKFSLSNSPIYLVQSASEVFGMGTKAGDALMTSLGINSVSRPYTFYPMRNAHYPEGIVLDLHPDPRNVIAQRLKEAISNTKATRVIVTTPEALTNIKSELTLPVQDLAGYLLDQINPLDVRGASQFSI